MVAGGCRWPIAEELCQPLVHEDTLVARPAAAELGKCLVAMARIELLGLPADGVQAGRVGTQVARPAFARLQRCGPPALQTLFRRCLRGVPYSLSRQARLRARYGAAGLWPR